MKSTNKEASKGNETAITSIAFADSASDKTNNAGKKNKSADSNTGTQTTQSESSETSTQSPFEQLFSDLLKDTYGAEKQITESLPELIEAATNESLKEAFEDHLHITKRHMSRLEKVFELLGQPAESVTCEAMAALIKEAQKCVRQTPEGSMTRDAGLIISAQKIEHYEIAAYGSLVQVALTLGEEQVATILEKTLSEEEDTDYLLTEIAESEINPMADDEDEQQQTGSEEDESDEEDDNESDEDSAYNN